MANYKTQQRGKNQKAFAPAKGASPETQLGPTPAPVNPPTTTAEVARSTSWGRSGGQRGDNPGKNGYGGPSSLNPSERAGPATINPQGADPVMDAIVRGGAPDDSWQTRKLDGKSVPVHPSMRGK